MCERETDRLMARDQKKKKKARKRRRQNQRGIGMSKKCEFKHRVYNSKALFSVVICKCGYIEK